MEIKELDPQEYNTLFPSIFTPGQEQQTASNGFGLGDQPDVDFFSPKTEEEQNKPIQQNQAAQEEKKPEEVHEANILGGPEQKKEEKTATDISSYFQSRVDLGKFKKIEEGEAAEDGTKKYFVPKTPEEFDEIIDIQLADKISEKQKEIEENWYKSKSPAWQAVAQYADMADDPAELIPFIQGVQNLQSVKDINEEEIDGAEEIVRIRLEQRGEPDDLIDSQIESLKTTDKLIATAKSYKPLILKEEKQQLAEMIAEKKRQEKEYIEMVKDIEENAIKAIESPIFGKQKLKQDEKIAVYELIGHPTEQKGYKIFSRINDLFEKKDFETLKQLALLLEKKDAFISYISTSASEKTASDLQKKLRISTESKSSNGMDIEDKKTTTVQRNQYSQIPKFGRY